MANLPLTQRTLGILLALALAVSSILFQSAAAPASIFGEDDRVTVGRADARFRPVGMARETTRYGFATAFLIDDCHALTAKHVIHHPNPIGRMVVVRFEPWRRSGQSNTTTATVVEAGGMRTSASDHSQDWALLRLRQCLGATLGHYHLSRDKLRIEEGRPRIAPDLVAVGFPTDRSPSNGPTVDPSCRVTLITSFGLLHDCATLPGNSGGPIVGWNKARKAYEVFAINVAGYNKADPEPFDIERANAAVSIESILPDMPPMLHTSCAPPQSTRTKENSHVEKGAKL